FPAVPYYNSSLNASSIIIDPDANDVRTVEIIFYNNSREHFRVNITNVANGTNQSYTLVYNNTNNFTSGQTWTAAFRIYDGINLSEWVNASVVINNTPSHNPKPFIFPNPAYANSSLNASSIIIDPDANDNRTVEIIFYNNSREHFKVNFSSVVNGTNQSYTLVNNATNKFTKSENWTTAFRVSDNSSIVAGGYFTSLENGTDLNNSNSVYFNTTFNISGFVQLNSSGLFGLPVNPNFIGRNFSYRGNYTSKIINANSTVTWNNFSWGEGIPYGQELVSNPVSGSTFYETSNSLRGFNMSGLVLLMHFNNDSVNDREKYNSSNGTVVDFSGNNNNGNATNALINNYLPGGTNGSKFNGGYRFDDVNDNIQIIESASLQSSTTSESITVSVWVYPQTITSDANFEDTILYTEQSILRFQTSDDLETYIADDTGTFRNLNANNIWAPNNWYNIVLTFDNTNMKIYKNGIEVATTASFSGLGIGMSAACALYVLGDDCQIPNTDTFNGSIDEVSIWNRTLSAQEVQDLYKRGHSNLSFQVRSCDDSSCSGESFVGPDNTSSSYFTNGTNLLNTSIAGNNQYFQYQALFERDINNSNFTPELYNFSINYNTITTSGSLRYSDWVNASVVISNSEPFNYTFNFPVNDTNTSDNTMQVEISNGTDIDHDPITYYLEIDDDVDFSSPEYVNTTISETINTTNDTTTALIDGAYFIRIRARDNSSLNGSFSPILKFFVSTKPPNLTVNSPENNTNSITTQVTFNATGTYGGLLINMSLKGNWTGSFIYNQTNTSTNLSSNPVIFAVNISQGEGDYIWSFRSCNSANNCNASGNRTITINISNLETYDQEDDPEDKFGFANLTENATLPVNDTFFFANYTFSMPNTTIEAAFCTISFDHYSANMSYDSSTPLYYYNTSFQNAGSYNWNMTCSRPSLFRNKTSQNTNLSIRIPLFNQLAIGINQSNNTVSSTENVNISVVIPTQNINETNNNISSVWVDVVYPNSTNKTYYLTGSFDGGYWSLGNFSNTRALGLYTVSFYANLSDTFSIARKAVANFTVENLSLSLELINNKYRVNTTELFRVEGRLQKFNSTRYVDLVNETLIFFLNETPVSLLYYNESNKSQFLEGVLNQSNVTNNSLIRLNLTANGTVKNTTELFSTSAYTTNSYNYTSVGFRSSAGTIFNLLDMSQSVGNLTYRYDSNNNGFINATITVETSAPDVAGGNTSLWYSLDYITWNYLNASTARINLTAVISINYEPTFYIKLESNTNGLTQDNPVTRYEINTTQYYFEPFGIFTSRSIFLNRASYYQIAWNNTVPAYTAVNFSTRTSNDNSTWLSWSNNLTNNLGAFITSKDNSYIQYRIFLETSNTSSSPAVQYVNISYSNVTTNLTGGYNFTFTVPTSFLGNLTLKVNTTTMEGLSIQNATNITVTAQTNISRTNTTVYSGSAANFTIIGNWSRNDTNVAIVGQINITLANTTGIQISKTCLSVSSCQQSFSIPSELHRGNYTVYINATNESAYFKNATVSFDVYLEEKSTTGVIAMPNRTIPDFQTGVAYSFLWGLQINNTGQGTMQNMTVSIDPDASQLTDVANTTHCNNLFPNLPGRCNQTFNITIPGTASPDTYRISWRLNWTNNDGTTSLATYTNMFVIIDANVSFIVSVTDLNRTIEHDTNRTLSFLINSSGNTALTNVNITLRNDTIDPVWVSIPTNFSSNQAAGTSVNRTITIIIPRYINPRDYNGTINISTSNGGSKIIYLNITVPQNITWFYTPQNASKVFTLSQSGEIANITLNNTGNLAVNFTLEYSPSGAVNYGGFGADLFEESYYEGTQLVNPNSSYVAKNSTSVITIFQKGNPAALNDVGVSINISLIDNSSITVPKQNISTVNFSIVDQPPVITNIIFYTSGLNLNPRNYSDVNTTIAVKVIVTDDRGINISSGYANISMSGPIGSSNRSFNMSLDTTGEFSQSGTRYIRMNFTGNFTPITFGTYNISAWVKDINSNTNTSSIFQFFSLGNTTMNLSNNLTIKNLVNISQITATRFQNLSINYTINNTGNATALNPNLSFTITSPLTIYPLSNQFGNISENSSAGLQVEFNVPAATAAGRYELTATLNWSELNLSRSFLQTTLVINVTPNYNISINISEMNISVNHNSSASELFMINNTGNINLLSVNSTCTGSIICNETILFNQTSFTLNTNSTKIINLSVNVSYSYLAGNYTATINVSNNENSSTFTLNVEVNSNDSYNITPTSITKSGVGPSSTGNIVAINITNQGNINLTFNISSTNRSIVGTNVTDFTVIRNSTYFVMVNFTAPGSGRDYLVNLTIQNMSLKSSNSTTITVNLSVNNLTLNITSPTQLNKTTNITAGDSITILAYASFAGTELSTSASWTASISGSNCPVTSSSYSSNWTIICTAPTLTDGINHNLSLTLTYTVDNSTNIDTEINATTYRDITSPVFNSLGKKHITPYNHEVLEVNATDNINISTVIVTVNHSNGTMTNYTMDYLNANYTITLQNLSNIGDYNVLYSANDTTNNVIKTVDWFGVAYLRNISGQMLKGNGNAQSVTLEFYRPNSTAARDLLANATTNSSTGNYTVLIANRTYDIKLILGDNNLLLEDINATNLTDDFIDMDSLDPADLSETIILYKPLKGMGINASNTSLSSSTRSNITFNYTSLGFSVENNIKIHKCASWNYSVRSCTSTWTLIPSYKQTDVNLIQANTTGFSAFFATENVCGNGLCESTYGETKNTCVDDCIVSSSSEGGGSSGGGGGGGLGTQTKQALLQLLAGTLKLSGVNIGTTSIYKELFSGEEITTKIQLKNTKATTSRITMSADGEVSKFIKFPLNVIDLNPYEDKEALININVPKFTEPRLYEGYIVLDGATEKDKVKIPITVKVLAPEGKLIEFKIEALNQIVSQGGEIKLQVDIVNLGKVNKFDLNLSFELVNSVTSEVAARKTMNLTLEDKISNVMSLDVPKRTPQGKYVVKGIITLLHGGDKELASSITFVDVKTPFLLRTIFGMPYWLILIAILLIMTVLSFLIYLRVLALSKRRYAVKVEMSKLPQPGKKGIFIGKVAETGTRAFFNLDKLQTHTLIAGATGGGKTVSAEVLVEEALSKGISVLAFDPTGQWAGFLRKNQDKSMLNRYKYFEMKKDEAKAFNGIIKTITDPLEVIELKKFMKPNEITIFNVSRLTPKQMDLVVASTIQQVFKMNLPESKELKTLFVYDEVHRLLPKFGGTGVGFIQLERGVREFRKWGIGLILISQVLSDFVGEIKANISTEIQTNTRYEDDLERIKLKYGDDVLKSVVKESVGTVMVVNAEYNNGRPYFVSFRPLLHNHAKPPEKELESYEKYGRILEELNYQVEQLKANKVDTLDVELELKLAAAKIKQGQFNLAEIYLESLNPKMNAEWKKIGKTPAKLVVKKVSKEEILSGFEEAKKEREKFVKVEEKLSGIKQLESDLIKLRKDLEEKKKSGVNTSLIEIKMKDLYIKAKRALETKKKTDLDEARNLLDSISKELTNLNKKIV
ncbi:DUF853 family protein, partial [Candidatus Woesearchaeota archaeon]|nr:DUF853 family protein [Candidatus Woesearchaeota archaeon]